MENIIEGLSLKEDPVYSAADKVCLTDRQQTSYQRRKNRQEERQAGVACESQKSTVLGGVSYFRRQVKKLEG